ncbi:MAG TPA: NUDIX domain-containing protein [Alphaproteobacteria bacterium]
MTGTSHPEYVPHYIAAYGLFRRGDKFLFMRRANTNYMSGYYGLPSGKVMPGEPLAQTILRELKEETGLDIKQDQVKLCHVAHRYTPDSQPHVHWMSFIYMIEEWEGEPVIGEPHKCDDLQWLTVDSDEKIIPYLRAVINDIQNGQNISYHGDWPTSQQQAA